jgi:hypothetical protein
MANNDEAGRPCAICGEPLSAETTATVPDGHEVHARCRWAGEHVVGVAAAILAEQRGALCCVTCLAGELGMSLLESQSALWNLRRVIQVSRDTCGCGAAGWRIV